MHIQFVSDSIIFVKDKFAELLVYAFVNICTHLNLTRENIVDVLNAVVLGENNDNKLRERFCVSDIARHWPPNSE